MEPLMTMTQMNDFIFCRKSLYYNSIYRGSIGVECYHQTPQKEGLSAHSAIDEATYSTRSTVLQGVMVFSERYQLIGRIDIFDISSGILTERKNSITAIYLGFKYQLYAQMYALEEMGYNVKELRLYSYKDNKVYTVEKPTVAEKFAFESLLKEMREWNPDCDVVVNPNKCNHCIYNSLCESNEANSK